MHICSKYIFWYFPLVIHSGISVFCIHLFISVASLSCMEVNFLNQNWCMPLRPGGFPVCYLFKYYREPVWVYVHLKAFFEHWQLCFHVVYPFGFFVFGLSVPIFCSKIFLPLSLPVVDMASLILPLIVGRIFFPVFSILFGLVSVSF